MFKKLFMYNDLQFYSLSFSSIISIEIIDKIKDIQPISQFLCQTLIAVLTIIYMIKKISKIKEYEPTDRN